ncbi:CoA ester lyase [Sulfitobacter sp. W002]|uniref:HpcH/HpaI aldolase/citrate lyase family protein n=1 Tax=Sulfitobacter sp. W002 TaxID=2867024 RepID=UPI0021A5D1A1|nr:CoA ester lyase [Sulfitobacter sp. W002]UWR30935.1 CoA ester lyase [Sulfitobacter sp. W002]
MRAALRLSPMTSALFVPAGNTKLLDSASAKRVPAVIVDLEDAIPPQEKERARLGLAADIARLRAGIGHIWVRINKPWMLLFPDLEAAVAAGADAIMVPKVERESDVRIVAEILDALSPSGPQVIVSQIESSLGLLSMPRIAQTRPDRHAALMLGPEDLALELGAVSTPEVMTAHAQSLITAARSGGLMAIGSPGSIAEITDMESYKRQLEAGKRMGFDAVVAIHPKQLGAIDAIFRPSDAQIAEARAVVQGDRDNKGRPFTLAGRMVDAPIVARARKLLVRCGQLAPEI